LASIRDPCIDEIFIISIINLDGQRDSSREGEQKLAIGIEACKKGLITYTHTVPVYHGLIPTLHSPHQLSRCTSLIIMLQVAPSLVCAQLGLMHTAADEVKQMRVST
jgi:hypothetical protein